MSRVSERPLAHGIDLPVRASLLAAGWTFCYVDVGQRLLSLSGKLTVRLPFWKSIDWRAADLQDLCFNEPWFLIEGILWGVIAWAAGLDRSPRRASSGRLIVG